MVLNETSLKTNNAISEVRRVPEVERSPDVISVKYLHSRPYCDIGRSQLPTCRKGFRISSIMQSCRGLVFLLNDRMTDQPYSSSILFLQSRDSSWPPPSTFYIGMKPAPHDEASATFTELDQLLRRRTGQPHIERLQDAPALPIGNAIAVERIRQCRKCIHLLFLGLAIESDCANPLSTIPDDGFVIRPGGGSPSRSSYRSVPEGECVASQDLVS